MNRRFSSVWDAIERNPTKAQTARWRATMMRALLTHIDREKLSNAQAAKLMGVGRTQVVALVRGQIGCFTVDALLRMLLRAGFDVEINVRA